MFAFENLTVLLRLLVSWDNLSAQTEVYPNVLFSPMSLSCHMIVLASMEKGLTIAWTLFACAANSCLFILMQYHIFYTLLIYITIYDAIIAISPLNAEG